MSIGLEVSLAGHDLNSRSYLHAHLIQALPIRPLTSKTLPVKPEKLVAIPENRLLAASPPPEWHRFAGSLKRVRFSKNTIIYEPGEVILSAMFVNRGVASVLAMTETGKQLK
jgi:hypothetical protein